jgi:Tripartite tricarboxylate transporter TctB family
MWKVADQKNFVTGLFYIAFGTAVAVGASRYQIGTADRMGPGYFPIGVGLALALTGLFVIASALSPGALRTQLGSWPLKNLAIVLGAVVLFGLLIEPMGLIIALPVLVGVSALAHPDFSWRMVLLSIIILLPLTWAIFVALLGLQFPFLPSFLMQ